MNLLPWNPLIMPLTYTTSPLAMKAMRPPWYRWIVCFAATHQPTLYTLLWGPTRAFRIMVTLETAGHTKAGAGK